MQFSFKTVLLSICVLILFFIAVTTSIQPQTSPVQTALNQCVLDEKATTHYHAHLVINYLGKRIILPDNIGIEEDCMHPIQVHDGKSGVVHVHFTRPYPFTVGDFFSVWGITFSQNQLGGTFATSRHRISMKVNGKTNDEMERYVFKSDDNIEVNVTPNYSE